MVLEKFVGWYIEKVWGKEFILREEIEDAIIDARKSEAEKLNKKFDSDIKTMVRRKDIEKDIAVAEVKAENIQLEAEMVDMSMNSRRSEDIFYKSIQRAKENARTSQDMKMQAKKLLDMSASIHGAIDGIHTRATIHLNTIEKEEKKEREKLMLDY